MDKMIRFLKGTALGAALILVMAARCGDVGADPPPSPPATPTGLIAEAGDAEVTLRWDANTEPLLAGYTLYWGTDPHALDQSRFVAAPTTIATIEDLSNGVAYHFAVDAEDTNGRRSERSETVTAVPQAAELKPPSVTATHPQDGDTGVAINPTIRATFSKAMDQSASEAAFSAHPNINCNYSWNPISTVMSCNPIENLNADTRYTVTIDATAKDTAGIGLEQPYTFSFTTSDVALDVCRFDESSFGTCVFGN